MRGEYWRDLKFRGHLRFWRTLASERVKVSESCGSLIGFYGAVAVLVIVYLELVFWAVTRAPCLKIYE